MRSGLARFVPALSWVPEYELSWLSKDAIAGFTIWGLLIPEGIAYASLAGLPPQAGLYTLLGTHPVVPVGYEDIKRHDDARGARAGHAEPLRARRGRRGPRRLAGLPDP